jgi:hypothetical protein
VGGLQKRRQILVHIRNYILDFLQRAVIRIGLVLAVKRLQQIQVAAGLG